MKSQIETNQLVSEVDYIQTFPLLFNTNDVCLAHSEIREGPVVIAVLTCVHIAVSHAPAPV